MLRKLYKFGFIVCLFSSASLLQATNATWTGTTDNDMNNPANWVGGIVPSGVATFDSQYPMVSLIPSAASPFTIDSFYFSHSASAFVFKFGEAGVLNFTGSGITGIHTDAYMVMTNTGSLSTAQLFFTPNSVSSSTIGSSSWIFTNTSTGLFEFTNAAQAVFGDVDSSSTVPITAADNAIVQVINNGGIHGFNEAAQIFLKGSTLTAGNHFTINAINAGSGSYITSNSDTGQIVFDAANSTANLTVGDNARFTLTNGTDDGAGTISSINSGNNAGQIVFDGKHGIAALAAGDNAFFALSNANGSSISSVTTGNDAGQMVFDGNNGTASFLAGDYFSLLLNNQASAISGFGFDTAQLVVDGDGGEASFSVGNYAALEIINDNGTISGGSDGNDSAQMLFDANGGSSSFSTGDTAAVLLVNTTSGVISSYYNAGQIVVDGNGGEASFTLGDFNAIVAVNDGVINNLSAGSLAGQIIFNGSASTGAGVTINTGDHVVISAVNTLDGTMSNEGPNSAAQMYFSDTTINGDPWLVAVNQAILGPFEGIVFDGSSTADNAKIALENSSLVVNTSSAITIAALEGDSTSLVKLGNDLTIDTLPHSFHIFSGVISGSNGLTIDGAGIQKLSGNNTYTGGTEVDNAHLILTGSVLNSVNVNNGFLSGDGTIGGSLFMNSGSTVRPGEKIGALEIGGNYTQSPEATFIVEVSTHADGSPRSSLLQIDGNAIIAGTVEVVSPDHHYAIGKPYTILTSSTLLGTFNHVEALHPFIKVHAIYNTDPSVQLLLSTDFRIGAKTRNQKYVARQWDSIADPASSEQTVINALLNIAPRNLPKALDQLSGEQYTFLAQINEYSDRRFMHRIYEAFREELDPSSCNRSCKGPIVWSAIEGGESCFKSEHGLKGFRQWSTDLSLGIYTFLKNCFLVGAAFNFEYNNTFFDLHANNDLFDYQGACYASYIHPYFYALTEFLGGCSLSNFERKIKFGSFHKKAHSTPQSWHGTWYGEAGFSRRVGQMLVQPFIGADVNYVNIDEIHEHKASSANLKIQSQQVTTPHSYLGMHLTLDKDLYSFNADFAWQHRFKSQKIKICTHFEDFGTTFPIRGKNYGTDGVYADIRLNKNLGCSNFYCEVSGEVWRKWSACSGTIGLDWNY